jgi:TolB-like protein/tetratricopeptide (TPR) repeat protein
LLLRYLVEKKLAGEATLKATTLRIEFFHRNPGHDDQADSIVRRTMSRLREHLQIYYSGEGQEAAIRFEFRKGHYLPNFTLAGEIGRLRTGVSKQRRILLVVERSAFTQKRGDLDELSIGLSEELVKHLNNYNENLMVVGSTAGGSRSLTANSLRLNYRLNIGLRTRQDDLRITFQLIDSSNGQLVWSQISSLRLSAKDLFQLLEGVTRQVASTLLDPHGILYQELKRKPPEWLGTYLAVFRYHRYQEAFCAEYHHLARESLEAALRNEPDYADAWAALANVYLGEALFGFNQTLPTATVARKTVKTAQKAVALEPRNVMANHILAMGYFYDRNEALFRSAAERALKLAPDRPDNLAVIGMHLMLAGDWDQGLALVIRAMELNPCHPNWHYLVLSLFRIHHGHYHDALSTLDPFADVDFFPIQINLSVIHSLLGQQVEARDCLERGFRIWPDASQRMDAILDFWFPFGDLANTFKSALGALTLSFGEPEKSRYGVDD